MKEELCDMYKDLDARLDKLVDDNLSGNTDDASCSCSTALIQIERKLLPYHKELQNLKLEVYADIGLIIGLISNKHLTQKEEQEMKRRLKEIKDRFNDSDSNKEDKGRDISEIAEQINNLLQFVTGICAEVTQG